MKFTKEQAYENIVSRLTSNGETLSLSERSINEMLETLMTRDANEEIELDTFVDGWFPVFQTSNANINHDVSKGIKALEEKMKPSEKATKVNPSNNSLEERLAEMEKKLKESEKREKDSMIRSSVLSKMKEKGVKNTDWAKDFLSEVTITDDFDVDAKVESYVKLYNKTMASVSGDVTPLGAGSGDPDKAMSDCIKEASNIAKSQNLLD